jgi:hypothetical protein
MKKTRHIRHWNEHRLGKRIVQAYLTPEENEVYEDVKEVREFASARELIVTLCTEEKDRNETP